MPTNRTRRRISRRNQQGSLSRQEELYLWSGHNLIDGSTAFLKPDSVPDAQLIAAAWKRHRAYVLDDFIAQFPCTRPWAWWKFDAPEPRQRLFSPDFLTEIPEPEPVYLERTRLLRASETAGAVRVGHDTVFDAEREYWNRCLQHAKGDETEPRPASKYVWLHRKRMAADRIHGVERGLWFDSDAADKKVAVHNLLLRHSKSRWAGKPFRLAPWQEHDIVRNLFGWMKLPEGMTQSEAAAIPFEWRKDTRIFRRFRTAYQEVARKNGKSTEMASIGVCLAFCDREPGAEVYCAATKKDQARIVHGEMVRMRRSSPDIKAAVVWRKSDLTLENETTDAICKPLGADADTLDGLNSHGNLIDELHQHKTEEVFDKLTTGTGARDEPLTVTITTAGAGRQGVCWRERKYGVDVLQGYTDDTYFCYIACADDEAKWDTPIELAKANPNLGISVQLSTLLSNANKARQSPSDKTTFLRMYCGIWAAQKIDYWLSIERWDECNPGVNALEWRTEAMERLKGKPCAGGLDIGAVSDLTVLTLAFPCGNGAFELLNWYWVARENAERRAKKDRAPYLEGIRDGFITATEGDETDYERVENDIKEIYQRFKPHDISGDPLFQGRHLFQRLTKFGVPMVDFGQNITQFAGPTRELEEAVLAKRLYHGNDPILRWMATNAVVYEDINRNKRPDKKRSTEKIDGIVTACMAIGGCRRLGRRAPGSWAVVV